MDVKTDVLRRLGKRVSRVDPDSNRKRLAPGPLRLVQRVLRLRSRSSGSAGVCERDEKRVALVHDLITVVALEGISQRASVQREPFRVPLSS